MPYGSTWLRRGGTALREVPPAIVRSEMNYLLNPAHADFRRIRNSLPSITHAIQV